MKETDANREKQLEEYIGFLKMPSISAKHNHIEETAEYLKDLLNSMGAKAKVMSTGGHPVVFGNLDFGKSRTLLVYNHYDVQPVDPADEWNADPFSATFREGRIYARGSSDNKGTLMARYFGIKKAIEEDFLNVNIKFLYEGEEEIGSPNLEHFVEKNSSLLKSDAIIMEGSTVGQEGRPVVSLGVKGLLYVELSETVADSDMHSSNAAIVPNPAWNITLALSKIYDGVSVNIPGFNESIRKLNNAELEILKDYPFDMKAFAEPYGLKYLKYSDKEDIVNSLFARPTMNIDGFLSGYVQEGTKTITPRKAMAKIDFRLVPDQDPSAIFKEFQSSMKAAGFRGEVKALGMEYPVRSSPDSALARAMIDSARKVYGAEPIIMLNSPGTQPMALFTRNLGIKEAVSAIGVGDQQSRAHAPNESVRVDYFFKAIEHMTEFLGMFR